MNPSYSLSLSLVYCFFYFFLLLFSLVVIYVLTFYLFIYNHYFLVNKYSKIFTLLLACKYKTLLFVFFPVVLHCPYLFELQYWLFISFPSYCCSHYYYCICRMLWLKWKMFVLKTWAFLCHFSSFQFLWTRPYGFCKLSPWVSSFTYQFISTSLYFTPAMVPIYFSFISLSISCVCSYLFFSLLATYSSVTIYS